MGDLPERSGDSARDAEKLAKKYDNIFNIQDSKGSDYYSSYL